MASIACIPSAPPPGNAAGLRDRARGALLGLAVGDALGAPAENMKPSEIRAKWGRITGYVAEHPAGTDDTEYAIFSGLLLARHGSALTVAHVESAWHQWIADRDEGPFRGAGFSERGTLENLRRGLAAPISAQHRHAWSDGLAMRAAPFGVFAAGRPAEAARLVAIDGSVSHEGEGIYGGQAVAAGVAAAMAGAPTIAVVASALAVIPDDSWTARSLRRAVAVAHRGERAVRSAVVIGGYPWTDLAPEAVALAFGAYAAADGEFTESVLTAVNMGRDADTTAAVAGALAGATRGASSIPAAWAAAIGPARGSCLPSMEGHHILDVAELLTPEDEEKWGAGVRVPPTPDMYTVTAPDACLATASDAGVVTAPDTYTVTAPDACVATTPNAHAVTVPDLYAVTAPDACVATNPDPYVVTAPDPCLATASDAGVVTVTAPDPYTVTAPDPYAVTAPDPYAVTAPDACVATTPDPYAVTAPDPCLATASDAGVVTAPDTYTVTAPAAHAVTAPDAYAVTASDAYVLSDADVWEPVDGGDEVRS